MPTLSLTCAWAFVLGLEGSSGTVQLCSITNICTCAAHSLSAYGVHENLTTPHAMFGA